MRIYALIMAGGMAKRMDGADKGLVLWHGKPLIDHVIDRIKPQVGHIAVSASGRGWARWWRCVPPPTICSWPPPTGC